MAPQLSPTVLVRFPPGLTAKLSGARGALRHFAAEYAQAVQMTLDDSPSVDVSINGGGEMPWSPQWSSHGGHKLTRWYAEIACSGETLRARIRVGGYFGGPLAQSQVLEPLLGVAARRLELAVIPGLAISRFGKCMLVIGGSGTGKTTLGLRAVMDGWRLVSDDQLIVDARGDLWPFPRRIRIYPQTTALLPDLAERLALRPRVALQLRRAEALATARRIRLPILLATSRVTREAASSPITRQVADCVIFLRRTQGARRVGKIDRNQAIHAVLGHMTEHRRHLPGDAYFRAMEQSERRAIERAIGGIPSFAVDVPRFSRPDDVRGLLALITDLSLE